MAVITLLDVGHGFDADALDDVLAVHAAGADPDVPEDPLPVTLCGLDSASLVHFHYMPRGPGEPWYPPVLEDRRCRECEAVLKRR